MRELSACSEEARAEAMSKYETIRRCVVGEASQQAVAVAVGVSVRTVQRWVREYRQGGLRGLIKHGRTDRGTRRELSEEEVQVIEGLALRRPRRSVATVYRELGEIARKQGWRMPCYRTVCRIVRRIGGAEMMLAQEGERVYREEYDVVYRRRAKRANEIWQADHEVLDIWLISEQGKARRPWLTVILDDYSRAVAGYRLSWTAPTALHTALALREAVWRKEDGRWHVCGIPERFYTDHGSDFTSQHMEQVGVDLKMELMYSQVGVPRGRGKIERFFRTVNQLLLERLPGYIEPKQREKREAGKGVLTLSEFEQQLRDWLLDEYHCREHSELKSAPQQVWEEGGFVPRMPEGLEALDLLLLSVGKVRRVQQDGISFRGLRYLSPTLAAYVKEEVELRYDPRDMAEIRVFHRGTFVCRAICEELSGEVVSLKEIVSARRARKKDVQGQISEREAVVQRYLEVHRPPKKVGGASEGEGVKNGSTLKRYWNE